MALRIDFRFVSLILFIALLVCVLLWRPWEGLDKQTIQIQGQATVKAAPNEFIFSPVYEKKANDSTTAISEVSKLGNEVVAKLKEMGVGESAISTNVTTQKGFEPMTGQQTDEVTAQFSITATVKEEEQAQKILDYIVTTGPIYNISPQSTFNNETRKKLENEARGQALKDARAKADQTAQELGVKVGKVVSVSEPQWGGPIPLLERDVQAMPARDAASTTPPVLLTGEQEVTYTVTITFQIR
jgi:uncharacterized protein YggE